MNYLLSQEEYDKLRAEGMQRTIANKKQLQEFCTLIACEMPILFWGRTEKAVWGCILSKEHNPGYCDKCPSQEFCPHEHKRWSK